MLATTPAPTLERSIFETPRAAEYFTARDLQAQTGQPRRHFAAVVLKELLDNALDACETAGAPPALAITVRDVDGQLTISVGDTGPGLPPATVQRILNFATRTSDKSAYRSPTRGAQGNALKTILGIPHALAGPACAPVLIEARGVRHTIRCWVDPAGEVRTQHEQDATSPSPGTTVTVTLPAGGQDLGRSSEAVWWARAVALLNPHATVRIQLLAGETDHGHTPPSETAETYHALVCCPDPWRKFLPTDLTSAWWYSPESLRRLVFSHIADTRRGGRDLTLREFVRQFRGLSGTAKAKAVCDQFPSVTRLRDLEDSPAEVDRLLQAMQHGASAPSPGVLGLVGAESYRARFAAWYGLTGAERFWYRKVSGTVEGLPFALEVALAETERQPTAVYGVNFSPTFEDPLAGTLLTHGAVSAHGLLGFLRSAHAHRGGDDDETPSTAVAVHLVCPSLTFLDRGKTRLDVPPALAEQIAATLGQATRTLYQEGESRRKDAARAHRAIASRYAATRRDRNGQAWTQKAATFAVLPEAHAFATGDGALPVSSRNLWYQVRPRERQLTGKELDYKYFSQDLLTQYKQAGHALPGLYYDPAGSLHEPHEGAVVPLGTREIDAYTFPLLLYNKILYVEKKGLLPILQAARLAERYDMAIIGAEGYATEAARTLFAQASQDQQYQVFVLHDADADGYNIARTLAEETRRMPGYQVDVIDLGLRLADARALNLEFEQFTRKKALPRDLDLTPDELATFTGVHTAKDTWVAQRVELNAMAAPQLVAHIERTLAEAGAIGKVLPSDAALAEEIGRAQAADIQGQVEAAVAQLLHVPEITTRVIEVTHAHLPLSHIRQALTQGLEEDTAQHWRAVVHETVCRLLQDETIRAEVEAAVQHQVRVLIDE